MNESVFILIRAAVMCIVIIGARRNLIKKDKQYYKQHSENLIQLSA